MCNDAIERWEMKVDKLKDKVSDLQSALSAENERLRGEYKALNRQLAVAKKIFDSCRNNDNHWGDVEVENHRLKADLAAKDAEIERLTQYRARMEEAHGEKLYAIEHLLDHFDDDGNLKGDGQWRIRAIWQCCKDFDEGSERAAKLSGGDSLIAALKVVYHEIVRSLPHCEDWWLQDDDTAVRVHLTLAQCKQIQSSIARTRGET